MVSTATRFMVFIIFFVNFGSFLVTANELSFFSLIWYWHRFDYGFVSLTQYQCETYIQSTGCDTDPKINNIILQTVSYLISYLKARCDSSMYCGRYICIAVSVLVYVYCIHYSKSRAFHHVHLITSDFKGYWPMEICLVFSDVPFIRCIIFSRKVRPESR